MANTIEDIQEYLKQDESEQKSPILFIHGEICSDKNLRIASPHRLLPCNTRYDPTFELKDHPSHLLGPVSQGSSSNPGVCLMKIVVVIHQIQVQIKNKAFI